MRRLLFVLGCVLALPVIALGTILIFVVAGVFAVVDTLGKTFGEAAAQWRQL